MEKLTIKDIAKMANVSTATVSNFLNQNYQHMSLKTRQKLETIVRNTNFSPNGSARNLAKNENNTIGVSLADITNPFTSQILSGICELCDQLNYRVLFTNSNNNEQKEMDNIIRLTNEQVAGMIVVPVNPNSPVYKSLSNQTTVMIDRQQDTLFIDTVGTDNINAVNNMVQKMLAKDYDDLYFVTWPFQNINTRTQRFEGFLQATKYQNPVEHLITVPHHGQFQEYEQFNARIQEIMEQKNQDKIGFFCMNARVLLRLLQVMQSLGYSYPKDYGVATYEEFDWMKVMNPSISCIRQDSFAIGQIAMEILSDKLQSNKHKEPELRIISTEQIIGQSF